MAVAFKLSNGPLAIVLPMVWLLSASTTRSRLVHAALGSLTTLAACVLVYGHWGTLLWNHFGNPIYPFYDHWFAPLRSLMVWQP